MRQVLRATLARMGVAASVACLALGIGSGAASAQVTVSSMPVGGLAPYAGTAAPPGWLIANGQAVSRVAFSELFAVIGTTYGAGDGVTTFNVPDLRQRFPLGQAASGTGATLGQTGGSIDHTHTGPSHTHTTPAHSHTVNSHAHQFLSAAGNNQSNSRLFDPRSTALDNVGTYTSWNIMDVPAIAPGGFGSVGLSEVHLVTTSGSSPGTSSASPTTNSAGTGATGSANPPFIAMPYIIHAKPAP